MPLQQPPVIKQTYCAPTGSVKLQVAKAALVQKDVNLESALDQVREVLVLSAPLKSELSALLVHLDATVFLVFAQHTYLTPFRH